MVCDQILTCDRDHVAPPKILVSAIPKQAPTSGRDLEPHRQYQKRVTTVILDIVDRQKLLLIMTKAELLKTLASHQNHDQTIPKPIV